MARQEACYVLVVLVAHLILLYVLRTIIQSPFAGSVFIGSCAFWFLNAHSILFRDLIRQERREVDRLLDSL
jgi:hypothetical protein